MGEVASWVLDGRCARALNDATTQLVAEKIIELAKRGLNDPIELHLAAIKEFG